MSYTEYLNEIADRMDGDSATIRNAAESLDRLERLMALSHDSMWIQAEPVMDASSLENLSAYVADLRAWGREGWARLALLQKATAKDAGRG
jgi:hypothetical protein